VGFEAAILWNERVTAHQSEFVRKNLFENVFSLLLYTKALSINWVVYCYVFGNKCEFVVLS